MVGVRSECEECEWARYAGNDLLPCDRSLACDLSVAGGRALAGWHTLEA